MNFDENLQDNRNHGNRRKNGHEHNSIAGHMIFPINDLDNIVPAILHIHLGIVLELFEDLEKCCFQIDESDKVHLKTKAKDKRNIKREITALSR